MLVFAFSFGLFRWNVTSMNFKPVCPLCPLRHLAALSSMLLHSKISAIYLSRNNITVTDRSAGKDYEKKANNLQFTGTIV